MYFKINDKLAMGAEVYRTRRSWGHKAFLYRVRTPENNDLLIERTKIRYYNRTWERFEFESILSRLVDKALKNHAITKEEAEICNTYIKSYQEPNAFGTVAMVAKMGEIFGNTLKERNDWKARMLKAGVPGLDIPDDWDTLSENEKEKRLNGALEQLTTKI